MSGVRAVVSLTLALAGFAACQKGSLQPGGPSGGIKPFPDGGPGSTGAAGAGGTTGAFDGGFAGFGFGVHRSWRRLGRGASRPRTSARPRV